MNKPRAKIVSLMLLIVLALAYAAVPLTMATSSFSVFIDPSSGTVPTVVKVWGCGASPCGNVYVFMDNDGDPSNVETFLGVTEAKGDGTYELCVTIPEAFCGAHDVSAWDEASGQYSAGKKFTVYPLISLDPYSGPVGTEVTVEGTGFRANVQIDIYFDDKIVPTDPVQVMTDDVGSFTATFIVPKSVNGLHYVKATDRHETKPCWDDDWFCVESKIVLDPTQGPCGTEVTITGTGFNPCSGVHIKLFGCKDILVREWIGYWYSDPDDRIPPVTDDKGSFVYTVTIDCTLEECCPTCPGPYKVKVHTQSDDDDACATFIVTPWLTFTPCKGPVGTEITAVGYGFETETVDVVFKAYPADILVAEDVPTDELGNFVAIFPAPEVVEGCYKIAADGIFATKCCGEDIYFEIIPWIWITPEEGCVGTEVTVVGKGWDNLRNVDVIYAGLADCPHCLLFEHVIAPHMALWCVWENTPICHYNSMIVLQPWGWALVGEAFTDENGSFNLTFIVPESTGGYHPIYAGQCVSTHDPYKWSQNVPVFRVKPCIWVEGHEGESEGLSGEYVKLYGTGFAYVEFWLKITCYPKAVFATYFRIGTFVLDFDSNKQWINEFNFIMNNEYSEGWQEMYWIWLEWLMGGGADPVPMFPQGYLPMYIDLSGSISHGYWWRWLWLLFYHGMGTDAFYDDLTYKGTPFLKVPVLQAGEKELLAYYFGLEFSLVCDPDGAPPMEPIDFVPEGVVDGVPSMLLGPMTDPMSMLFGLEPSGLPVTLGKIYTETASTTYTIIAQEASADILNRLDELEAKVTDLVEGAEGSILARIETTEGTVLAKLGDLDAQIVAVNDGLVTVSTNIGEIKTELVNLGASITAISGNLVTIETALGTIQADLDDIKAKLVSLENNLATIETNIGTITTSLGSINTNIEVINGNIALIKTDVGTIKGTVTQIDGHVVTIETDIGELKGTISQIKSDTGLQPATIGLSILAAISAIAAAVMILRKVYLK